MIKKITITYLLVLLLTSASISNVFSQNLIVYNSSNSGLPDDGVTCVTPDKYGAIWIGTSDSGIVKFHNNQWTRYDSINSGLPENKIRDIVFDRNGIMWVRYYSKGLGRFDGYNWYLYNQNNSPVITVTSLAVDSSNSKWMTGSGRLMKYNDSIWTIYDTSNVGYSFTSLQMDFEGDTLWFAAGLKGLGRYCNGSLTYYNMQNSGMPDNVAMAIYIDKSRNKWVGTYFGGAAKFNSVQNIWTVFDLQDSLNLGNNFIAGLIADDSSAYFATDFGLYRYSINGFHQINSWGGVNDLKYDKYSNLWVAYSHGIVIYNPNGIVSVKNDEEIIPDSYDIIQNYPNPFNIETKIKVTISKNTAVSLNIYDMNGRFIKQLTNARYNKGSYKFKFNGNNLASGFYFAVLQTEKGTKTHKIVLLK